MNKIDLVKTYVDGIISGMPSNGMQKYAYTHTYGVAQCCTLLALKRGLDPKLAYVSGLLHDIYAYKTGSYLCHSQSGAEMVRVAFKHEMNNAFTDDEKMIILSAIYHQSNKELVHDAYDEVLKDADVLQPVLNNGCTQIHYLAAPRLERILKEFGFSAEPETYSVEPTTEKQYFNRGLFADAAQQLAQLQICGEKTDSNFMEIIRYYPEVSAFDELKNAWCGAFVYHCALKAGMALPIKQPPADCRFAGVGAWVQWGRENGFCLYDKDGFVPGKGDIVIYNGIVPKENKTEDSLWHDHIGIVLSCEGEQLTVAEGNIDNNNVSGLIQRDRGEKIGCFVRIPDGYVYDGWKYDYKTGRIRVVKL